MGSTVRRDLLLLSAATLALYVPFLGKAYHIDDPLVVLTAQQITAHPFDFYGYSVNWYGYEAPMAEVNQNPPGAAYYAALFGLLFGWSEPVMHASVALLVVALVCGVYLLARTLRGAPMIAALIALASPGVFVSGTTVMTDLPMTTCWVWAVTLWVRGIEDERPAANVLAAVCIAAGMLTKYYALSLVPLLLVYTACSGKRRWARALWLLLPVVVLALYEWFTYRVYGTGHFFASFGYAEDYHARHGLDVARKVLSGLAFFGAGSAPALLLSPWLWRGAARLVPAGLLMFAGTLVAVLAQTGWQPGASPVVYSWWFWVQYAVWFAAGLHVLALIVIDLWTRRDRSSLLLAFWILGTLVFGMFLYHLVNIRVLLPAFPAVALLCARRWRHLDEVGDAPSRVALAAVLSAALALTLCVAYADTTLANAGREAATQIAPEKRGGTTWFSGHWGFQYYMQAHGARPIDQQHPGLRPFDTVATPVNASNRIEINTHGNAIDQSFDVGVCPWLSSMHFEVGAGFYADIWGPLPFVFGPAPPEHYDVQLLSK